MRFKKDDAVIEAGQAHARIYHIVRGRCRVETEGWCGSVCSLCDHRFVEEEVLVNGVVSKQHQVVGVCGSGEMFGEKTFLFGGEASASVYADWVDGETEVTRKERECVCVC
jgi:CRP-like cAMP-binding protein